MRHVFKSCNELITFRRKLFNTGLILTQPRVIKTQYHLGRVCFKAMRLRCNTIGHPPASVATHETAILEPIYCPYCLG